MGDCLISICPSDKIFSKKCHNFRWRQLVSMYVNNSDSTAFFLEKALVINFSEYYTLCSINCQTSLTGLQTTLQKQQFEIRDTQRVQTIVLTLFGGLVSPPIREPASGAGQPMGGEYCAEAGCRAGRSYRFGHFSRISSLSAHTLPPHQRAFISAIFLHST